MNGLAQLAVLSGFSVSGSDREYRPGSGVFKLLESMGICFFPQDGSGINTKTDKVVFSTAIESTNPDLIEAKKLNTPLLHRANFLKELIGNNQLIAVAGTAGKTTTTGMLGWIFECLGKNPSIYNGAAILNWKTNNHLGNVRKGSSNLWIIEADESDQSFLNFTPSHSIITNISKDHYELDELHCMFNQFEALTKGVTIRGDSIPKKHQLDLHLLGQHNQENANCAFELCMKLGLNENKVREAISRFKGIERRLEIVGQVDRITVIDDYAHNPAKIAAALSAVAETYGTVHAFWRPHGFSPLFKNLKELGEVFSTHWKKHGGSLFLLPVYYAGGTAQRKATSKDLQEFINSAGVPCSLVTDYATLQQKLKDTVGCGDAILGMGARDSQLPLFAKQLVDEWKTI